MKSSVFGGWMVDLFWQFYLFSSDCKPVEGYTLIFFLNEIKNNEY